MPTAYAGTARVLLMSYFLRKLQHSHMGTHARTEAARERRNCVRDAKSLQKVQFRAPCGAAPLKGRDAEVGQMLSM